MNSDIDDLGHVIQFTRRPCHGPALYKIFAPYLANKVLVSIIDLRDGLRCVIDALFDNVCPPHRVDKVLLVDALVETREHSYNQHIESANSGVHVRYEGN